MTKDSSAKRKAGKRKPEKLSFTQDFIPIKNLEHGIIETTDGRYIKILEIEPINFMLRSEEEQYEIICSFASWLKISPVHLQFKSITRKADSDKHIAMLRKEMETEESEQCKKLSEGYIRLIKDVGSREALTRRFFLIFRYEELRRNENSDYGQICSTLLTTEQNARAYFMQCGNNILQPKDPDEATAEILYMFFNRRSCVEEPFHSRVDRIVLDTMAAKNKVIGIDPIPHIRMAHFIAPRGIDLMHRNYIIMDGLYYSFLYIKGNGYPNKVRAGWMSSLINAGEGIDVDVFLRRENRSKTIDKVAQRIRLNRTKLKSMQDTSTDYEELAGSIQAGYFIKQGIANYNEDLFYMSVFVTVSARTYEELMWRKQQMTDMLKSMDMYVSDCSFQQEDALRTVMPFLQISPKLEKKSKRNVLTSGAASTYMFTSFEMSDDTGVLLGINRHNNSLCIVDLFDTKKNKNANLNLLGTSGAGKTFTMQLLALRMRMRGIQCYIIAPIKGHEFRRACNRIGGQFIKIAPGSPHCINIMEIRHTISPEMELIDELDYSEMDSLLAQKIQQLMIFFSLLIPDMTNEEEQMLDEALIRTYGKFGMQVPVETLDAFRIVKHLQQQGEDIECMDDFWERYTEPALLNECGFFVYFLKTQGPEEACIFLQGNRCRIHTVNPRACRIYPLVVDPKENGRYEYLVSYERMQHFKGPKVHVKTWMKKRVGEEDRAFLNADFGSAKELARLLRQIPDERKKRALMCFHWAKYGNFDTGKPFLPQYERNLKVLREYLKELTE